MAIIHQTTNITVVKHQGTTLATVYHQGTKVFPDQTYEELGVWLSVDYGDNDEISVYITNLNNFAVDISYELEFETSTDYYDEYGDLSLGGGGANEWTLWTTSAEYNWVELYLDISGGGFSWTQTISW